MRFDLERDSFRYFDLCPHWNFEIHETRLILRAGIFESPTYKGIGGKYY